MARSRSISRSTLRAWLSSYLIALTIATPVMVGALVGVNLLIDQKIKSIDRVKGLDLAGETEPAEPANFLLIGSDTRAFIENETQEESFGDPAEQTGQRSDTLMIVHVDPEARTGLVVSFPRDLLVQIPDVGESKINAAFNAGPQRVIDTIKANFDIDIHHYLEIDFSSFEGIVNAAGGVPIYLLAPARDKVTKFLIGPPPKLPFGYHFEPGCYQLDGAQALAYVRSRNYESFIDGEWIKDPTADLGRITRQQAFMKRLATEMVIKSLGNPLDANDIANEALGELQADEDLSRNDVNKLIQAFRRVDPNNPNSIEMLTVPTTLADNNADLILEPAAAEPIFARLRDFSGGAGTTDVPVADDGPRPAEVRVHVLNASGVDGAAADASASFDDLDFQTAGVGNNPDRIDETEVRYRPGSEAEAETVAKYLGGDVAGVLVEDESVVEADVTVVLGSDFDGVSDPGEEAPATTVPPSTVTPPPSSERGGGGGGDREVDSPEDLQTEC